MTGEQAERIAVALERIALVLEGFESVAPEPCAHQKREDFSSMGVERWQCLECPASVGMEGVKG